LPLKVTPLAPTLHKGLNTQKGASVFVDVQPNSKYIFILNRNGPASKPVNPNPSSQCGLKHPNMHSY